MLNVQIKIVNPLIMEFMNGAVPLYATEMSAAADLIACVNNPFTIEPGEVKLIPTGIAAYIGDPNFASVILPRSGLGHKQGLILGNGTGLIDADYQGELFVSAWNRNPEWSEKSIVITPGMTFAQLCFLPIARANFELVEEFRNRSGRGEGGFGSTDAKRA